MHFHSCWPVLYWVVYPLVNCLNWQENIRPKLFAQLTSRDCQTFVGTLQSFENVSENGEWIQKSYGTDIFYLLSLILGKVKSQVQNPNIANLSQEFFTTMLYTNLDLVNYKTFFILPFYRKI